MSNLEEVQGQEAIVRFDGSRCIHARSCVLTQPAVFRANVQGPWIHPDSARPDALVALAQSCPSGAITVERLDGGPNEPLPPVNLARVRENGPLALQAELRVGGEAAGTRATLCRCGASGNKPYCDGSHNSAGFVATGEPATQPSEALAERAGPLEIKPLPNGPLMVTGNLEVTSGTGRTINRAQKVFFCRCGGSANKPYCDGTHRSIGFTAP